METLTQDKPGVEQGTETQNLEVLINQIAEDGDCIFDVDFLGKLAGFSLNQRLDCLAMACRHLYIGPQDFEAYFEKFPEDAPRIVKIIMGEKDQNSFDFQTMWHMGSKLLKPASQKTNWEEDNYYQFIINTISKPQESGAFKMPDSIIRKLLDIGSRSGLARNRLVGDYKHDFSASRFDKYGSHISQQLSKIFMDTDNNYALFHDPGATHITEFFDSEHFTCLSEQEKSEVIIGIIENAHNMQIWQETNDSQFLDEADGLAGALKHSLLYDYGEWDDSHDYDNQPLGDNPYREMIQVSLQALNSLPSPNVEPTELLEFWDKNKDPLLGHIIYEILTKGDKENFSSVAGDVLSRLKKAEENDKKRLLSLLFRFELENMGVDSEGVEYLGKIFHLGKDNDPNYFVNRLTASGVLGVFSKDGENLVGIFDVTESDLLSTERILSKELRQISVEILFSEQATDALEMDRRQSLLEKFRSEYFGIYFNNFNANTPIQFNNLEIPEQGWVLQYLDGASEEQKTNFYSFLNQFGEDGFRAFRSMEFGEEMAEQIMAVSKKTEPRVAGAIFKQYSRIINATRDIVKFAEHNINSEIFDETLKQRITTGLLRRGRDLIAGYAKNPPQAEVIYRELDDMATEVILLSESFKAAKRSGAKLELEDFNAAIDIRSGMEIGQDRATRDEIIRIFKLNWDNQESEEAYPFMLEELEKAMVDPNQKFYLIKQGEELIGFQRFKPYKAGEVYAASNNIRKSAQGAGIGSIAQRRILAWEASHNKVVAHAFSGHQAITHYLAQDGFVAIGLKQYKDTGDLDFEIVRDDRSPGYYAYRGAKEQEILEDFAHGKIKGDAEILQVDISNKVEFYSAVTQKVHRGKVITSFFHDKNNPVLAYVVFEPSLLKAGEEARSKQGYYQENKSLVAA